jgi:hypothetical protein
VTNPLPERGQQAAGRRAVHILMLKIRDKDDEAARQALHQLAYGDGADPAFATHVAGTFLGVLASVLRDADPRFLDELFANLNEEFVSELDISDLDDLEPPAGAP